MKWGFLPSECQSAPYGCVFPDHRGSRNLNAVNHIKGLLMCSSVSLYVCSLLFEARTDTNVSCTFVQIIVKQRHACDIHNAWPSLFDTGMA